MIETLIYFEAYRPILKALQMISPDRFPLARSLLKLSDVLRPPNYITSSTTYDFTPLMTDRTVIEEKYKSIPVLRKEEWPTSDQLNLNPKQYEAFMLALTNQVALIQGRRFYNHRMFLIVLSFSFSTWNWKNISGCTNHRNAST